MKIYKGPNFPMEEMPKACLTEEGEVREEERPEL